MNQVLFKCYIGYCIKKYNSYKNIMMNNMVPTKNLQDDEEARRLAQQPVQVKLTKPSNPWGNNNECLGLKIVCGVLGLIVVILIVVLVIKMVGHKKTAMTSPSQDSDLPMSLQGGFNFANESLMSTSV